MRGVRSFFSWIVGLGLAVAFALAADAKLLGDPETPNIVFSILADKTGYDVLEPTGRYVVGMLEAFAALVLFLPFTRRFGAFIGFCIAGGAVALHMSPYLGQEIPLELGGTATDGGGLFYLAIALTACSGLLMFIHPGRKRRRAF